MRHCCRPLFLESRAIFPVTWNDFWKFSALWLSEGEGYKACGSGCQVLGADVPKDALVELAMSLLKRSVIDLFT